VNATETAVANGDARSIARLGAKSETTALSEHAVAVAVVGFGKSRKKPHFLVWFLLCSS